MSEEIVSLENKALKYILTVYRCRSVTKAAEELFLSQPALSKYLQSMEQKLGFKLFSRCGHGMIPTWECEILIARAQEINALENRLQGDIINMKQEHTGRLRFALPIFRSPHIVPRIVPPFHEKYPNVELKILETAAQSFESLLLNGQVDFAITNVISSRSEIRTELIRKYDFYLAVAKGHPLETSCLVQTGEDSGRADIRAFTDEEFILQTPRQLTRTFADSVFARAQMRPKILLEMQSIETAALLVSQGCGACFIPGTHLQHLNMADSLSTFLLAGDAPKLDLGIAYLDGMYMPEYFSYFLELCRSVLVSG